MDDVVQHRCAHPDVRLALNGAEPIIAFDFQRKLIGNRVTNAMSLYQIQTSLPI